jgi:hypothetical protein
MEESFNGETSMDSNQQSSILSRSRNEDDIVEIEGIIHFQYISRLTLRMHLKFLI